MKHIPAHVKEEEVRETKDLAAFSVPHEGKALDKGPSPTTSESAFTGYSWKELERAYVVYLLEKNRWNVTHAAHDAKINRSTFDSRMKKLGIRKR